MDMCIKQSEMWISCRQLYTQYTQIRGINFLLNYPLTYGKSGDIISFVDAVKRKSATHRTMIIEQ